MQTKLRQTDRKKAALLLVLDFLQENNYLDSLQCVAKETGIDLYEFHLQSNISLDSILRDHQEHFHFKYGKNPVYYNSIEKNQQNFAKKPITSNNMVKKPVISSIQELKKEKQENTLEINAVRIQQQKKRSEEMNQRRIINMPSYINKNSENYELAKQIQHDIIKEDTAIKFSDVVGQELAKQLILESVKIPLEHKELFDWLNLQPWKGILLYGPPGTGKTMMAKAVAKECNTTFFNISASSIVSKYHGESEKSLWILFEMARANQPSTIFIDEIDSIIKSRNQQGEHEASRWLKTELLIQLDGLRSLEDERVFVLCATNNPWELDMSFLRRLEKRIYVGNLDSYSREELFLKNFHGLQLHQELSFQFLGKQTEGYSGSDLMGVIKEIKMEFIRKCATQQLWPGDAFLVTKDLFAQVMGRVKSIGGQNDLAYEKWKNKFGSN